MTIDEASTCYNIPLDILREYEGWGLCNAVKKVMGAWQYDDQDIERLSMIMTLHDIGFNSNEVEHYMRLLLEDGNTEAQRLEMLNKKRSTALDEIHFKEMQLDRLDYLRHKIQASGRNNGGEINYEKFDCVLHMVGKDQRNGGDYCTSDRS